MIKVQIVFIGIPVYGLRKNVLSKWKSSLFQVSIVPQTFSLNASCDLEDFGYSDRNLQSSLPNRDKLNGTASDLLFYILDVPLEENHFSRIISDNRIVISFYQIKDFLNQEHIPLENHILSLMYTYVLLFKGKTGSTISMKDEYAIAHDFSEGCLFDMCWIKKEVVHSCVKPTICEECIAFLKRRNVPISDIIAAKKEMKHIQRNLYDRIMMFLKFHPIYSLVISGLIAIILGIVANIICKYI